MTIAILAYLNKNIETPFNKIYGYHKFPITLLKDSIKYRINLFQYQSNFSIILLTVRLSNLLVIHSTTDLSLISLSYFRCRKVSLRLPTVCKQSLPNSLSRSLFHNCSVFPLREGLSLSHCSSYLWSACFKSDSSIGGGTFDPLDAGGNFRCKLSRHISRRGFGSAFNMPKCFLFGLCLSIEDVRDLYSQYSWRVYFFILTNYLNKYFNLHVKMKTSRVVSWLRHAA